MSVVDFDQPTKTLRTMAKAIAMGVCPEDEAFEFLEQAFRMGRLTGKRETYLAERRANEALKSKREASNG